MKNKMNKKGIGGISTFLNAALVLGVIYFIVFIIIGGSGGFSALSKLGTFLAQLPGWLYAVLGIIVLFMWLKKRK